MIANKVNLSRNVVDTIVNVSTTYQNISFINQLKFRIILHKIYYTFQIRLCMTIVMKRLEMLIALLLYRYIVCELD